jgi:hypothetical protein
MSKLYSTVYKSVVRAVNDLVKDIQSTMPDQRARYWTWESRDDEDKLPRDMLVGVNGFAFDENLGQWLIRFGISISTVDDANLLTEAEIIDMTHDLFGEKKKIALLDPDDASVTNELVSVHWEVLPMVQTQLRNYRSIGVELRRTGT